jgi:hypothetical protein
MRSSIWIVYHYPQSSEEFVGVVRRYGVGAAAPGVRELVEAAQREPEVEAAEVSLACGTCGLAIR